jgi:hypothetical protein
MFQSRRAWCCGGRTREGWLRNLQTQVCLGHRFHHASFSPKMSPSVRLSFKERHRCQSLQM